METGVSVGDGGVDGGAEGPGVEGDGRLEGRAGHAGPFDGLGQELFLQPSLTLDGDVLPLAGAAAPVELRTRGRHPFGRRFDQRGDGADGVLLVVGHDPDVDALAGQRPPDEDGLALGAPGDGVTTARHRPTP